MKRALSSTAVLVSTPSWATEAAASPASGLAQMIFGLAIVLGLIVLAGWLLRRFGAVPTATGSLVRVVTAASVGPRERVVVVEVHDTWLVLGVAPGRVNTLCQLPRQELAAAVPHARQGFAKWLADARRPRPTASPSASE